MNQQRQYRRPQVALVDYGMGNLRSVAKALEKSGACVTVTASPSAVRRAHAVVLPGVGHFDEAARRLRQAGLTPVLKETLSSGKPFLGICLGLQLLFDRSEESRREKGLGYFRGVVRKFKVKSLKVPHMGWNTVEPRKAAHPWMKGLQKHPYFYFVHSYYPDPSEADAVAATTRYGKSICAAAARGNVFATQFHPEKSGKAGLRLLSNFVKLAKKCS